LTRQFGLCGFSHTELNFTHKTAMQKKL